MSIINYEELVPEGVIFNLQEIQEMKAIKVATLKKLIANEELVCVRVGNKLHIPRVELIRFLKQNTTERKKK